VQTLEAKYPEIRSMRHEMVSTISQELSAEGTNSTTALAINLFLFLKVLTHRAQKETSKRARR
jgi:hypothetical protein